MTEGRPAGQAPPPSGGEAVARILLVEEVRRLLDLMKNYLKRTTCRVLTARDAAEAIRLCRKDRPDLVFLDAAGPGAGGIAACREIKADPRLSSIPVVLVAPRDRMAECARGGCDDVLAKPVTREEFLAKVRRFVHLLERSEARIPVSLRVTLRAPGGEQIAWTRDLSLSGIFLKTERPLPPGTRLHMSIPLERGRPPVEAEGEVRRVVEPRPGGTLLPGVGVLFLRLSPAAARAIGEFITRRRV